MATKKVNKKQSKSRYATHLTTAAGDRVYVSAKTQEDLDRKIAQLKLEQGVGVNISDNTLFNDYADMWLRVYKKPKVRLSTYQQVEGHLRRNIKPAFAGKKLKDIKPIHIQDFLTSISGYCRVVQNSNLSIVRQIFSTAEDNGLIYKSPVRSKDKVSGKDTPEKEPLTDEQACRLLEAVQDTPAYLFCLIALSTGMRRGEIMGLMWEDVDFDAGYINVNHNLVQLKNPNRAEITTELKSESARRRIPMPFRLRCVLELEHRKSDSPYVFGVENGAPPHRHSFDLLWRHVQTRTADEEHPLGSTRTSHGLGRYTVSLDFHSHPHLLRHTYITQLFEAGLDIKQVQYLAGHSSPDVTLRIYTHYREKQREQETAAKVLAAVSYLDASAVSGSGKVVSLPHNGISHNRSAVAQ